MIDRSARNTMAEAIRQYLTGAATNTALDKVLFGLKLNDPAINAIRQQLWLIYDDLKEHRHEGAWTMAAEQREVVLRIIQFLESDCEYQWPKVSVWYRAVRPLIWLLTWGLGARVLDRRFELQDSENLWPFRTHEEVQVAMSHASTSLPPNHRRA